MQTALAIATEFAPDRAADLERAILRHMEFHMQREREVCVSKINDYAERLSAAGGRDDVTHFVRNAADLIARRT